MTLLVLAALSRPAPAAVLTVGASGRDHTSIQDAIDAASDGDVIQVDAGTYAEALSLSKDLTLESVDGADRTVITAAGPVLAITSADATVAGFTIAPTSGRGITVRSGVVSLDDLLVSGASSGDENGAGIYALSTTLNLDGSTLQANDAGAGNGGNLYVSDSTVTITGSGFVSGLAERGGGLFAYSSDVRIVESTFDSNAAVTFEDTARGGAIRAENSTFVIEDSAFRDNEASGGYGGGLSVYGGSVAILDGTFAGGAAIGSYGGAIALYDADLSVEDTSFEGNAATYLTAGDEYPNGGAIVVLADALEPVVSITDVDFVNNEADGTGGALRVYGGTVSVSDSTFTANEAARGGAVYSSANGSLVIEGGTFTANAADSGGAVYWRPEGGAGTLDLSFGLFEDNAATGYGGALYAYAGSSLSLRYNTFRWNDGSVGGAAMIWAVPSVEGVTNAFCANYAMVEEDSDGGAVFVYQAGGTASTWTNNLFVENAAWAHGGGLFLVESGASTVQNNHFVGNQAERGGGAYFYDTEGVFTNNLVAWSGEGDGLWSNADTGVTIAYNDLYGNEDDSVGGALDADGLDGTNLALDPLLGSWTADGDCSSDDLLPGEGSPLLDAGDPAILDTDGSRSDIGAYGGPDAAWDMLVDEDGDGWPAGNDCDDADEAVSPDAEETAYDGKDNDCDGADLTDVDQDGYDAEEARGDDCDDADPAVHPAAEDAWYDGVDSDCDRADDYDADGDGHAAKDYGGDDCDDADPAVHPGVEEGSEPDGVDQDCDGLDGGEVLPGDDTGEGSGDDTGLAGEDDTGIPGAGGDKGGGCECSGAARRGERGLWAAGLAIALAGARRRRAPQDRRPGAA